MKITTWNVNGYRAVLKKGFKETVAVLDPDVLCLQEIKVKTDQLTSDEKEIPGYTGIWHSAERPGYSGVALFAKNAQIAHTSGLGIEDFDKEGRLIRSEFGDCVLFSGYFPNGQRGQERVDYKLRFYAELLEQCDELHSQGKNVIITGDFNTAHNDIDLANPKENSQTSGFLPEERVWIDHFLEHGFADAFRLLYPEKVQYSWWTYRVNARARGIGWRLDYFLVSEALMPKVKDVVIHEEIMGSDHCPVSLVVDVDY